jgi:hypothetical protein
VGDVVVDNVSIGAINNYEFTNVLEDHSIYVEFVEEAFPEIHLISLSAGWNIFSSYLTPVNADFLTILEPLIQADALVKVQDQAGNAIEFIDGQWVNGIGDFNIAEGYKIKVNKKTNLYLSGFPVTDGVSIPLTQGWNIMGYPYTFPQDAKQYVNPLIDEGKLQKVQSQRGAAIELFPNLGWINNIGFLFSGQGYKVRVNSNATLNPGGSKMTEKSPTNFSQTVFTPSWVGYGVDHHNIYIKQLTINGKSPSAGTQIGVFDGEICVGIGLVGENTELPIRMVATSNDPYTLGNDGFTTGNTMSVKIWDAENQAFTSEIEITPATGSSLKFEPSGTSVISISAKLSTTDVETISDASHLGNIFPNPVSSSATITFLISKDEKVTLSVFNLVGQRVKTLVNQTLNAGQHQVEWNPAEDELAYGVYIIKMETYTGIQTKRVVFSR